MPETSSLNPTRDEFAALLDESFSADTAAEGSVVKGRIVAVQNDYAIIDVGLKTEGRVPLREFQKPGGNGTLGVGDEVEVYLERNVPSRNEALITIVDGEPFLDDHAKHRVCESNVGAGPKLKMKVALASSWGFARIDYYPDAAVVPLLPHIFVEHGKGLGAVGTGNEQHFGKRDIAPRIRGPVDTKCLVIPRGRRDHTEPAVVIDISSTDPDPGELAHYVGLFCCK